MVFGGLLGQSSAVNAAAILVTTALVWVGSGLLERSAETIAEYYGLPPVIQGSVIVAIGSSFPELSSVVFTALLGAFDMGIGAIVGSAIFNILVIPGLAGIASESTLDSSRTLVYKEAQFYMLAVSALVVTFALGVIYYPVPGPTIAGEMTRPLALIPLSLYGLYLFIQWQDVGDHDGGSHTHSASDIRRAWAELALGLLVILVAVEQLVTAVEGLTRTFGIPEFLAGVTIIAAATSLPDALVSVRAARDGNSVTSLGNVLGSNTFDLLVAIPIGVLIVGTVTVNFSTAIPMMGVLTLATILLFALLRTDLHLSTSESYALLGAYLLFVAWVVTETIGLTSVIQAP
jgi:cation:H+ antiporter